MADTANSVDALFLK